MPRSKLPQFWKLGNTRSLPVILSCLSKTERSKWTTLKRNMENWGYRRELVNIFSESSRAISEDSASINKKLKSSKQWIETRGQMIQRENEKDLCRGSRFLVFSDYINVINDQKSGYFWAYAENTFDFQAGNFLQIFNRSVIFQSTCRYNIGKMT